MIDAPSHTRFRLLTLVFTDLADSVAFKRSVGEFEAARLIGEHRRLLLECAAAGGRVISEFGDGFFVTFESPSMGVEFALQLIQQHSANTRLPRVRIGLHTGEVSEGIVHRDGAEHVEISGVAVDLASRFQSLAMPGQILLSRFTFDSARPRVRADNIRGVLAWRAHGAYRFKGWDDPVEVYEAGITGVSPLLPPPNSDKAARVKEGEDESIPGWRPAQGLELPRRANWTLEERLGSGAFGEVWRVVQRKTGETRVLKFCYSQAHLRSLKREVTLFRLLRDALGDREDIGHLIDWQFDEPPFYIEMRHFGGLTADRWLQQNGGAEAVPLARRLELVAKAAEAVAAAHSVGVLHKDIKPSNILIKQAPDGTDTVCLIDFGIGFVTDRGALVDRGITSTGMTEGDPSHDLTPHSGTRLYMAPEIVEGRTASIASDIYSLGIVLYQFVIGDFSRVLAPGWQRNIGDPLLMEDIEACVDGNAARRFPSAGLLATKLRRLDERRKERQKEQEAAENERAAAAERERALVRQKIGRILVISSLLVAMAVGLAAWHYAHQAGLEAHYRSEAEVAEAAAVEARTEAVRLKADAEAAAREAVAQREAALKSLHRAEWANYRSTLLAASVMIDEGRIRKAQDLLLNPEGTNLRKWEWGALLARLADDDMTIQMRPDVGIVLHAEYSPDGQRIVSGGFGGRVTLWDARNGSKIRDATPHRDRVWTVRYSHDGRRILTVALEGDATLLDSDTLEVVARFRGHRGITRAGDMTRDGRFVITGSQDQTIRFWDAETGSQIDQVNYGTGQVYDLRISPDGKQFAVASLDRTCSIWDMESRQRIATLTTGSRSMLSIGYSQDGSRILAACSDGTAYLFDASTAREVGRLTGANTYLQYAAFSPDGRIIATADDGGRLTLWDATSLEQAAHTHTATGFYKVAFSPDSHRLLATSTWSLRVYDVNRLLSPIAQTVLPDPEPVRRAGSPGIRLVDFIDARDPSWYGRAQSRWDWPAGPAIATVAGETVWFDPYFVIHNERRTQRIDIDRGTLRATVSDAVSSKTIAILGDDPVHDAAFSPDGKLAVTVSMRDHIRLWETGSWREIGRFSHRSPENWFARFSTDSSSLLAGYGEREAILWDVATRQPRLVLTGHSGSVVAGEFRSDGRRVLTCSRDHTVRVWNTDDGTSVAVMRGHSERPSMARFSADGTRIVTSALDNTVKVWDAETGDELLTVSSFPSSGDLLGLLFLSDGNTLAVARTDGMVYPIVAVPPELGRQDPSDPMSLLRRVELWKRQTRVNPETKADDIAW